MSTHVRSSIYNEGAHYAKCNPTKSRLVGTSVITVLNTWKPYIVQLHQSLSF